MLNPETGAPLDLVPRHVVLTAGAGNADLRERAGLAAERMQRRPLHMAVVRGNLPWLNGHCVDGTTTRVTITSSRDHANRVVWQIGGQVAERGVADDTPALVERARTELLATLPGLELNGSAWSSYRIDRAEAANGRGVRPDDAAVFREGNVVTAWPTKLALVPRLVDRVVELLGESSGGDDAVSERAFHGWPRPGVAAPPWEVDCQWTSDV